MQVTLDVPERFSVDYTLPELAKQIKLYAAFAMFRAGKLSAGGACEFADIDRYTFMEECFKQKIPVIDYEPGELEAELNNLRNS
jgi:predicted HTH domain antitoxin